MTAVIALLLQAAETVATQSQTGIFRHSTELGIAALIAINGWQLRAIIAFRDEARTLNQWAFGALGASGVNSDIRELDKLTATNTRILDNHEQRIVHLEGDGPVHIHMRATDT